jgi:hypothetical protein
MPSVEKSPVRDSEAPMTIGAVLAGLELVVVVVLLLLLLLLHAAMASVEVATATTAASVLLIRASFCTAARRFRAAEGLLGSCKR